MRDHHMNCKAAANRIKVGVPATIIHGGGEDSKGQMLIVFHTVQAFITTMDQLKLEMKAVDEVSSSALRCCSYHSERVHVCTCMVLCEHRFILI
jgi:hypothetical protein